MPNDHELYTACKTLDFAASIMAVETATKRKWAPENLNHDITHNASRSTSPDPQNDLFIKAARWRLEQDYEQRPRKQRKNENESSRLPIKTAEGLVKPSILSTTNDDDQSSILSVENDEVPVQKAQSSNELTPKISATAHIRCAQEELARIANLINENPEEHTGLFRPLAQFANSPNQTIKKLALATQMSVFRDIIPGYRIRPPTEADAVEKVSKDVKRVRNFEQGLIGNYQSYVRQLGAYAQHQSRDQTDPMFSVSQVAISCACSLLLSVPHFNFRGELLQIMVLTLLARPKSSSFTKCINTLETLFRDDEDGKPSLDAVAAITKALKDRNYQTDEAILNSFLHLRLLGSLSVRASYDKVDRPSESSGRKGKSMKQKREFRTKKQRKVLKEQKKVERDFKEANATVDHEEYERIQSEILKLVFMTYFRTLKARTPGLMGAVLEGLSKYTHLINQDFFGDILEALKDLIQIRQITSIDDDENQDDGSSPPTSSSLRSSLLCITTAFTLLSHQDVSPNATAAALALDLHFFTTHLYRILYTIAQHPDLETSLTRPMVPDPDMPVLKESKPRVNASTMSVLLLRSLNSILAPRSTPPLQVAAFVKTLLISSLQLPEKSTLVLLVLLQQIIKVHGPKVKGIWDTEERRGDGVFDPFNADIEGSNPFASTVWEGEVLRLHFSPKVKEATMSMERLLKEP